MASLFAFFNLGPQELIILLVIVILFGSAKLPTLARSLGKSMRILKAETKGMHNDDDEAQPAPPAQGSSTTGSSTTETPPANELQDRAARLRAEATRLDQEAVAKGDDADALNGVPVSDPERARRSS